MLQLWQQVIVVERWLGWLTERDVEMTNCYYDCVITGGAGDATANLALRSLSSCRGISHGRNGLIRHDGTTMP